jgi:hypothetical protein
MLLKNTKEITMARMGVSYNEVAEAATQLVGQGRNPTVEQVRLLLGTGSSTTIANHLRQWKANQESTSLISAKENLPPEFVAMMKGLWERLINHSEEEVGKIEKNYQQTVAELQQDVEKYKTNNQRWQKLHDQWLAEKNQWSSEKLTLEQALEFAHKEIASLHAKQDAGHQQLRDKQERVDELHRLHKQTQNNLEHYRESTREQRLLDQQQQDQQKQQLQLEIKTLNEQLVIQREKISALQQQSQLLQQTNASLEKRHTETQSNLEMLRSQCENIEKTKNEHLQASQHWQNQYKETQIMLNNKINQLIDIQAENKLLSQQLANTQQVSADTQDQNKMLNHDKWVLGQEKAQLEGQLKQMQKIITA